MYLYIYYVVYKFKLGEALEWLSFTIVSLIASIVPLSTLNPQHTHTHKNKNGVTQYHFLGGSTNALPDRGFPCVGS